MKAVSLKVALFLICCFVVHTIAAQEMQSGLLLVSEKKSKLIPLNKKVKIWAGEDNKVYRAKILAVDDDFVYLSTGQRLPIKSIKSIKRKRIMLRDVGKASVATGVVIEKTVVESALKGMFPEPYDMYGNRNNDSELGLGEGFLFILGGAIVSVGLAVGVGIVTGTVGVLFSLFEPRYHAGEWEMVPYNPARDVMFVNN